jgi:hypothetical protein
MYIIFGALAVLAGYLMLLLIILFCITAKKSVFFNLPASGVLAFLAGIGVMYAFSLSQILLVPFGVYERWMMFVNITISTPFGLLAYGILMLMFSAVLFAVTANLLEKRVNI